MPVLNTVRALLGLQGIHAVPLFKTTGTRPVGRPITVNPLENSNVPSSMSVEFRALDSTSVPLNGSNEEVQTRKTSVRSCSSEDVANTALKNYSKL